MKKVLIFLFAIINIYAVEFDIKKIDKNSAIIDCKDLKVGENGLVVKSFGDFNTIVSNAVVTKIENDNCVVELKEFQTLKQLALPSIKESPAIGDKVIFQSLNKRALIVAQNSKTYDEVAKQDSSKWIHPDLFATYLESENNPSPTKESFTNFCEIYSIGLIHFALDKEYVVDCESFKILQTKELNQKDGENIKPFYSRSGDIKPSFFSFKKEIVDYMSYYKTLLGLI